VFSPLNGGRPNAYEDYRIIISGFPNRREEYRSLLFSIIIKRNTLPPPHKYTVSRIYIATCPGLAWLIRRVLDLMIEFLDLYITVYSSSQITIWHTVIFFGWTLHCNYRDFQLKCQLSLTLMLRPTVSRPVYLGIKHPSGAYGRIFISVWQLRICWCETLSLTRGRVCRLQLLLTLASIVILGPFLFLELSIQSQNQVKVILRPPVSRPVCLGIKHPSGAYDQIFITVRQLRVCMGRSRWREDGSVVYFCCWSSPAQSFSGPSSLVKSKSKLHCDWRSVNQ
jgi:hypothetical protein